MPHANRRVTPKNGAPHASVARFSLGDGAIAAYDDPMSKVLGLDAQTDSPAAWLAYILGAIALFLGLMVTARAVAVLLASIDAQPQAAALAPQEIEVMKDEPPPPPPAETAQPEPAPPVKATPREAPPPAAAPAQAAKVLTQEPDPNEPVDLTGNTIVQGNADSYAGGTTAANGTSTRAVRNIATSPTGTPASSRIRGTHSPVSGVNSDGFNTTPLPAATADATSAKGMPNGMFHGVIAATTPRGSYRSQAFFVFRCSCEKRTRSSARTRGACFASHVAWSTAV